MVNKYQNKRFSNEEAEEILINQKIEEAITEKITPYLKNKDVSTFIEMLEEDIRCAYARVSPDGNWNDIYHNPEHLPYKNYIKESFERLSNFLTPKKPRMKSNSIVLAFKKDLDIYIKSSFSTAKPLVEIFSDLDNLYLKAKENTKDKNTIEGLKNILYKYRNKAEEDFDKAKQKEQITNRFYPPTQSFGYVPNYY